MLCRRRARLASARLQLQRERRVGKLVALASRLAPKTLLPDSNSLCEGFVSQAARPGQPSFPRIVLTRQTAAARTRRTAQTSCTRLAKGAASHLTRLSASGFRCRVPERNTPPPRMKQIVGFCGGAGNSQSAPVRSYVLYFERLAGWAEEGQGPGRWACPLERPAGWTQGRREMEQGLFQAWGEEGTQRRPVPQVSSEWRRASGTAPGRFRASRLPAATP